MPQFTVGDILVGLDTAHGNSSCFYKVVGRTKLGYPRVVPLATKVVSETSAPTNEQKVVVPIPEQHIGPSKPIRWSAKHGSFAFSWCISIAGSDGKYDPNQTYKTFC